jgi:hypothetical protein
VSAQLAVIGAAPSVEPAELVADEDPDADGAATEVGDEWLQPTVPAITAAESVSATGNAPQPAM